MSHLESDAELYAERLSLLAHDLNRLDSLSDEQQAATFGALSVLRPDDLIAVLAARDEMAMLMLKLAVMV